MLVVVFAVGAAEGFGGLPDAIVEGDHLRAAHADQVLEAGRSNERKQGHAQEPPAQAKADDKCRQPALHADVPEFHHLLLQPGRHAVPALLALVAGPPLKDAGISGEHIAIVDGQMEALPLDLPEFGGLELPAKQVFIFRMENPVERFQINFLQEGEDIAGAALGKAAEPSVNSYGKTARGYRSDEREEIHRFLSEIPRTFR